MVAKPSPSRHTSRVPGKASPPSVVRVLASVRTFAILGVNAHEVTVEVDVRNGLPTFSLVGLPDTAVRESRERVRAALVNSGFEFPLKRITASLAPSDLRKAGPGFDLAIAAALLVASEQLDPSALDGIALSGELALDGGIRPVPGALAMAEAAGRSGARALVVAQPSAPEAALATIPVVGVSRLDQLQALGTEGEPDHAVPLVLSANGAGPGTLDLADLRGQPVLRRALEVAAAGGHSLLVTGPPGAGKSMAARRLPSLLPPLTPAEAIDVVRVAGACGRPLASAAACVRPFRVPHHTISAAGLVGGGSPPRPGEATLAHRGVLFLDELPEFRRDALEALRQPLEEGRVLIVRARHAVELPCRFQLVAAANPCPCGHGADSPNCQCPALSVRRYSTKLTGALADRIDVSLRVEQPEAKTLRGPREESSSAVRERVLAARERQHHRLRGICNAEMTSQQTRAHCLIEPAGRRLLDSGQRQFGLSGRGYERVLRVARTFADLGGRERIGADDLSEALTLRRRVGRSV
jgi:magnesium chelatase family protein